ncbi:MAG TPA: hypothetical protein VLW84_10040 [Terriglobales bacterium]|nr:hypothetical protein [Terriglobales bacterium]
MKKISGLLFAIALFALAAAAQTLPAGTPMRVKLENNLATTSTQAGDPFSARVMEPVTLDGKTVVPIGTTVEGRVTTINNPRRIAGKPTIGILPETMILPSGERLMLNATLVDTSIQHGTDVNNEGQFKGKGIDGKDAVQIGMGTGGGMIVGGLIGGAKGVLIGAATGATLTVAHWLGKKRSTELPAGTELDMELSRPLVMTQASGQ